MKQLLPLPNPTNYHTPSTKFHSILEEFNTALQMWHWLGRLKRLEEVLQELVNVRHAVTRYFQKAYIDNGKIDDEIYFMCGQLDGAIRRTNQLLTNVGNKETRLTIKKVFPTKAELKKLRLHDVLKLYYSGKP